MVRWSDLDALESNDIDDNTFVIYASDNGPWLNYGKWGGSAGPLREGKGTMWDCLLYTSDAADEG